MDFPGEASGKNLPANARDIRDKGLIPGLGRYLEEGMATHSSILAWGIPWTEEPCRLQSTELKSRPVLKRLSMHVLCKIKNVFFIFVLAFYVLFV